MRTVFISYSNKDRDFAERLATDLRASGAGVWFDQWEIKVGDSITQKINDGIHDNTQEGDYLILCNLRNANQGWHLTILRSQAFSDREVILQ